MATRSPSIYFINYHSGIRPLPNFYCSGLFDSILEVCRAAHCIHNELVLLKWPRYVQRMGRNAEILKGIHHGAGAVPFGTQSCFGIFQWNKSYPRPGSLRDSFVVVEAFLAVIWKAAVSLCIILVDDHFC